jgi:DNA ligase (NAD+)
MTSNLSKISNNPLIEIPKLTQKELEEIIVYSADKYYNTGKPVIEDNIYDLLFDYLKDKYPKSKVIKNIGAPIKSKNKVKLPYWLGSMDKIKPNSGLDKWTSIYKPPYYLSDKLDGISALLVVSQNSINLYTRGTATEGLDISRLVKYLDLPKINRNIAIRGELIMKKKTFEKKWKNTKKNIRNTIAGLVNSKTIDFELAVDTEFVAYEVVDPFTNFSNQMEILKELNLKVVHYKKVSKIDNNNFELILSEYLKDRRKNSEYEIDGIIVTNDEKHKRNTSGNPKYAFAFKDVLEDQMVITKVLEVEWNISKDGNIIPTLLLEPVNVGGVTIQRVTGHNAKFIKDNKIGKNTEILLVRSGDVIPYVKDVIKSTNADLPTDIKWEWNNTNVDIVVKDKNNEDLKIKEIVFFFATLGTKGLGEGIVNKLYENGFDSVLKILKLTKEDLLKIDGFKEKSANNLISSIKKSVSNVKLERLMAGSNKLGQNMGEKRIKMILDKYPNLLDIYKNWTKQEFYDNLVKIDGFNDKTANIFIENIDNFVKFYNKIKNYITIEKVEKKPKTKKNMFTDKNVVISGFRDKNLEENIINSGGNIQSGVSSKTDFLIVKDQETIDNKTGKVKKALDLGIKILTLKNINV